MSNKNEEVNQRLANKMGTWHLDAWEEFTRLDKHEQKVWEQICSKGRYIPFKTELEKSRSVIRVYCPTTGVIYPSVKTAARILNLSSQSIYYSIKHNVPVLNGYEFQYVEE